MFLEQKKAYLIPLADVVPINGIGGVMVSVLASRAVDRGFETWSGHTKDYKIGIVASPLNMQHEGIRTKTDRLGIRFSMILQVTMYQI